jgi:hypothetical protein
MDNNEASDLIEAALNEAITSFEDYEEGDLLVDWVVVAYVTNPDKEKRSMYPMLYPNGEIPTYRARGLLTTGLMYLRREAEEEED